MHRFHGTLLLATLGASFAWHVLAMIVLSSVVVVTVGDPNAGYREVDFTEIDFAYDLVSSAPPITKHFEPPKLPAIEVAKSLDPLQTTEGQRKLFDAGFSVEREKPGAEATAKEQLALPPAEVALDEAAKERKPPAGDVEVRSGVYDAKGRSIDRAVVFKPSIPNYPLWAEVQGREFKARFSLAVSPGGRVLRVRTILSSGSSEIDRISISYLRKWKFVAISARRGVKNYIVPVGFVLRR